MIKVFAAALALAVAAAPGVAMAKSYKKPKTTVAVAATLGTANWFVFGPGKHGKWFKPKWTNTATAGYVIGSIGCAAATPILVSLIEQRQLSSEEVLWSTATCFFPPLIVVGLLAH
jgi:hypothetical protein